jgi:hypothetical protein
MAFGSLIVPALDMAGVPYDSSLPRAGVVAKSRVTTLRSEPLR